MDPPREPASEAVVVSDGQVHVIRHALALDRHAWVGDDRMRPLNEQGRAQARALVGRYPTAPPDRLLSSPALRCIETLQPTADTFAIPIEQVVFLAEGAPAHEARRNLIAAVEQTRTVTASPATRRGSRGDGGVRPLVLACTHGDVLEGLIELLVVERVPFDGAVRTPKSVTYELEVAGGSISRARVVEPPE
jgi:broad specificity phosphatase PhoE